MTRSEGERKHSLASKLDSFKRLKLHTVKAGNSNRSLFWKKKQHCSEKTPICHCSEKKKICHCSEKNKKQQQSLTDQPKETSCFGYLKEFRSWLIFSPGFHYEQFALNITSYLEWAWQYQALLRCQSLNGQNSIVNSVCVDDWTVESNRILSIFYLYLVEFI